MKTIRIGEHNDSGNSLGVEPSSSLIPGKSVTGSVSGRGDGGWNAGAVWECSFDCTSGCGDSGSRTNPGKHGFDNAFLYAFSSYAGSFLPSQIWALQDGQFVDVTRQYPAELRAIANQMREAVLTVQAATNEVNGILAGYVAPMILLGEYEQGWAFMLANYDRTSDWGLEIYKDGQVVVYRYPDFLAALEAFLTEQGYLPAGGAAAR